MGGCWDVQSELVAMLHLNGRVLYYDPKEGQYYDPLTDFYVDNDEVGELHGLLMDRMRKLS